ncbi:hypothetical protein [Paraclostridium sordellii]|uniref:hypothetical protein n=1 Tax=Paraclostridium sordellii TaxID=1505 RepID=UPI0005E711DD|nr:hypothetical protein [Paeniclostridium sordellii]MDU6247339.1 hypothetical protein [Paeniclostridium sordellii]CEN26428.1 Uncharacterised protein [[Clostridium] sordellii] [Paeniclostridium sordellii]
MNILNIRSNNLLLKSYKNNSLNKVQVNVTNNKQNTDTSLKELHVLNKGKHLAKENLDTTYNSSINKKMQESLERKLSQLGDLKSMIENKDEKDNTEENPKVDSHIKITKKIKDKNLNSLSDDQKKLLDDEQISLEDINKKIAETHIELKEVKISAVELGKQSEMIDYKISMFKKMYGNDTFKKAEKEAILKQVYDARNNPLLKQLKNTFNEVIELETKLRDKLNQDQSKDKENKKEVDKKEI